MGVVPLDKNTLIVCSNKQNVVNVVDRITRKTIKEIPIPELDNTPLNLKLFNNNKILIRGIKSLNIVDIKREQIFHIFTSSYNGNWGLKWLIDIDETKSNEIIIYLIEKEQKNSICK